MFSNNRSILDVIRNNEPCMIPAYQDDTRVSTTLITSKDGNSTFLRGIIFGADPSSSMDVVQIPPEFDEEYVSGAGTSSLSGEQLYQPHEHFMGNKVDILLPLPPHTTNKYPATDDYVLNYSKQFDNPGIGTVATSGSYNKVAPYATHPNEHPGEVQCLPVECERRRIAVSEANRPIGDNEHGSPANDQRPNSYMLRELLENNSIFRTCEYQKHSLPQQAVQIGILNSRLPVDPSEESHFCKFDRQLRDSEMSPSIIQLHPLTNITHNNPHGGEVAGNITENVAEETNKPGGNFQRRPIRHSNYRPLSKDELKSRLNEKRYNTKLSSRRKALHDAGQLYKCRPTKEATGPPLTYPRIVNTFSHFEMFSNKGEHIIHNNNGIGYHNR